MIELLRGYLEEWRTKAEILSFLNEQGIQMDERKFRKFVEIYDKDYCDEVVDTYIAHSNKGYIITADKDIIRKSMEDDLKRAYKLLKRGTRVMRRFREEDQLTIIPVEMADAYDIIMKVAS